MQCIQLLATFIPCSCLMTFSTNYPCIVPIDGNNRSKQRHIVSANQHELRYSDQTRSLHLSLSPESSIEIHKLKTD